MTSPRVYEHKIENDKSLLNYEIYTDETSLINVAITTVWTRLTTNVWYTGIVISFIFFALVSGNRKLVQGNVFFFFSQSDSPFYFSTVVPGLDYAMICRRIYFIFRIYYRFLPVLVVTTKSFCREN